MREISRGLITLKPKQSFVDWLNSWSKEEGRMSLEEAHHDPDAILIPEFDSEGEAMAFVSANAQVLFEHVLEDWCADRSLWPSHRNFETLCEWFEIVSHSVVCDVVDSDSGKWERN